MADTDGPHGQMSGAEAGRYRTEGYPMTTGQLHAENEILREAERVSRRVRGSMAVHNDIPFDRVTIGLIHEIAVLGVELRAIQYEPVEEDGIPLDGLLPFSKDAWFRVLMGAFVLVIIALVPFTLLTHRPPATWGFFMGMVAGIFIILSILSLVKLLRSPEEWEKARYSGEIIAHGDEEKPDA